MVRYELLLISRKFQHPRQFELVMSGRISGKQLAALLQQQFPEQRWYSGMTRIEELEILHTNERLLLSELPQPVRATSTTASCLKLYVLRGPDAGAWIPLTKGEHFIGRTAPLWLEDPLMSRVHAKLVVTTRGLRLVACSGQQIAMPDGSRCESIDLEQGSRFLLGNTEFAVGDPITAESGHLVTSEQLEIQAPSKPELSRLIALVLAAFVPIISGILLALVTGSMLFLILSGVSALMGLVPAGQLFVERRQWKKEMEAQRASAIIARTKYSPALGESFVAGLDSASLGLSCAQIPPLVWGEGLWSPQEISRSDPTGVRKIFRSLKKIKSDAPWFGPVFFTSSPSVWQLKSRQGQSTGAILAAVLARYLPAIHSGQVRLVIDPSIRCLPASLLLMGNVSLAHLSVSEESSAIRRQENSLTTLYVTAQAPQPLAGTLVLGISPVLAESVENWIDPSLVSAHLPDERLILQSLSTLSLTRFDKMVQQYVQLQKQAITKYSESSPSPSLAIRAHLGLGEQQEEVFLDLHEDGPHVLVCGTTGSGKSEALRRIISDFARNYSPAQLAFALIDFKGGAGLSVYASLPHVQLFASDLDEAAAQRTLEQLEHEVRRREELLADQGCSDIAEYQDLDESGRVLPRLLVVIDEFRVFVETLPLASVRIDRLAAVGRALGIHLFLSTQRPAGALTGQTKANLNTTIALRVNDSSESVELVGSTEASKLLCPGQAIIKSASKPTRSMQFHLAIEPPLHGELFERNRQDLSLLPLCRFESSIASVAADPLRKHAEELSSRWSATELPVSGFAPALPLPAEPWHSPDMWNGKERGTIYCGVADNLHLARLEPLILDPARSRSTLICGLPEAGARNIFASLAASPRKILCFGPSPIPGAAKNVKVVTGEDPYGFLDAVDFVESMPKDPALIILVHSLAQLQSNIHPQHFQRLDEALGTLLRSGGPESPMVIYSVDRDQNTLKSTGLCTEQWFFPFNATESLKMIWPKIPACSLLPGRGVKLSSGRPPQVFQLTKVQSAGVAGSAWPELPSASQDSSGSVLQPTNFLGYSPFDGATAPRPAGPLVVALCPDMQQRQQLSAVLAARWNSALISGISDFERFVRSLGDGSYTARQELLCLFLETTNDSRLPLFLDALKSRGISVVLFVPPSSRMAYDLGMSANGLDDRQVIVIEAHHPQDLQPMNWPPIHQVLHQGSNDYWCAIISKRGKPRVIHIPHELSDDHSAVRPVSEECGGLRSEEHHHSDSGDHDGKYRRGRHHRDIGAQERNREDELE
ncbi:FtsK/SpoIIIE domain-containing protein [Glutamicibacter sp.]|uniref:FtsK/SpoIIIE domain-containing protein n=1 Tax=Glutamicibacter sp. TaxID=1931995 RepID=UPI003D6B9E4D